MWLALRTRQDEWEEGNQMTGYGPLMLHVPEPAVRPGGTPDFSSVPDPGVEGNGAEMHQV